MKRSFMIAAIFAFFMAVYSLMAHAESLEGTIKSVDTESGKLVIETVYGSETLPFDGSTVLPEGIAQAGDLAGKAVFVHINDETGAVEALSLAG